MDIERFFVDWFPYYAWIDKAPGGVTGDRLWPDWGFRFLGVALCLYGLMIYASGARSARRERTVVTT
jgi:hypothetical protein